MQQAAYYLDQSREGASYSLALIGDRASGKTSLLNSLGSYGDETGLVAGQIRLDEGYSKDELDFFREVFHSLMEKAAEKGVFGGESGVEFDTFCRQILTHDLSTSRADEPLAFGRVYATARAEERPITLSRRMLLSDLGVIVDRCRAAGFPAVVLLLDEADVLASNHALLQTIRNLLMDSSHFSMIAAGTEQMFPAISEVFSPVPRQFVRINVGPFKSWSDTRKAIQRRLVLSGEEWAMPGDGVCKELHSLTRGNPYEVMLVSHFAYKELTRIKQRVPMEITPTVIEAVADQLEEQNPAVQKTLARLREMNQEEAETIRELIDLNGTEVREFAFAELDLTQPFDSSELTQVEERVEGQLKTLSDTGFLSVSGGKVRVEADSFQRALIRYVVLGRREEDESAAPLLPDPKRRIADNIFGTLDKALRAKLPAATTSNRIFEIHAGESPSSTRDSPVSVSLALESGFDANDYDTQVTVRLQTHSPWIAVYVFKESGDAEVLRDEIASILSEAAGQIEEFGVDVIEMIIAPVDLVALEEFRAEMHSADDRIEEAVYEAKSAFSQNRPDMSERVEEAAALLLQLDEAELSQRVAEVNDTAFMALAIEDEGAFVSLSDRLMAADDPPILHEVTRALWEAVRGDPETALRRLDIDGKQVEEVGEQFTQNLLMYSPAVLASETPTIAYGDLIGDVSLSNVIASYKVAIEARKAGESVATALGSQNDAVRWQLGAAADAAELERRPEYAKRLRRLAADRVDYPEPLPETDENI